MPFKISGAQLQNRHSENSHCNRLHGKCKFKIWAVGSPMLLRSTYAFHRLTHISFRQNLDCFGFLCDEQVFLQTGALGKPLEWYGCLEAGALSLHYIVTQTNSVDFSWNKGLNLNLPCLTAVHVLIWQTLELCLLHDIFQILHSVIYMYYIFSFCIFYIFTMFSLVLVFDMLLYILCALFFVFL